MRKNKQDVEFETAYFENQVIPNYKHDLDGNVKQKILQVEAGFERIEKRQEEIKVCWHKEVDDILTNLKSWINLSRTKFLLF